MGDRDFDELTKYCCDAGCCEMEGGSSLDLALWRRISVEAMVTRC